MLEKCHQFGINMEKLDADNFVYRRSGSRKTYYGIDAQI